jgi:hypothetical protein
MTRHRHLRYVVTTVLSETLGLVGIALEMLGVALAAIEYSGHETFTRAQKVVREHFRLRYSPVDFSERLAKNDLQLDKKERRTDRIAFAIATTSGFVFLFALFLLVRAARIDQVFIPVWKGFSVLASLYWSILPTNVWLLAGGAGAIVGAIVTKKRPQNKGLATMGKFASAAFLLAILPVAIILVPYVLAFQWIAKRVYALLHASLSEAGRFWDVAEERQGKPLLLLAAAVVMLGLAMQAASVLSS